MGLILLGLIITIVGVIKFVFDQQVNPIIIYIFWLVIGVNMGVNWGIEAMKHFRAKVEDNTDYKRSKD